ncbi:MAG: transporter substrate-binding domain-containing protein, partial [Clostridia bacterium]|nr:transporter substrate-binding domain-containing protein [Clostridia bacterium]
LALAVGCVASMAACGGSDLALGKELLIRDTQLDALMSVDKGEADAAVIDSVMAGYYATKGDLKGKIKVVEGLVLAEEEYGIAAKKENQAFMSKINEALIALAGNGGLTSVASEFGLQNDFAVTATTENPYANATDSSWETIKTEGTIVIGYTVFAPIAYEETPGTLTGFDVELAKDVVEYLNSTYTLSLELEFQIIDWNSKETLLENGTIDLVWNGMTINADRLEAMCISVPYLKNKQVAVVSAEDADKYKTADDFKKAVIAVEGGSAGESVVKPSDEE